MTITHQILSQNAPVQGGGNDAASQLSGMVSQVSALAGGGVGLPGLQSIGSAISSLASSITGAGSSLAGQISTLGSQMAFGAMSGASGLASQMSSLMSQLTAQINPSNLLAQVLHTHVMDKNAGIKASAFQGQHTTTWDQNGVTHTSKTAVTSTAPRLPHNGNMLGSDNLILSKILTAGGIGITSDRRLKSNIANMPPVLDLAMQAGVKTFDKKFIATDADGRSSIHDDGHQSFGFIAQDLRAILPMLVDGDEADGFLSVQENKVGIIALAALQEFVRETRIEIAELKRRLGES